MRRKLLLLLGLTMAAVSAADLPSAWRSWRYSRPIDAPRADMLNYFILDRDVFAHSENRLGDLRVIDDSGQQTPYELRSQITPPPEPVRVPAKLRENSFVPGKFTQVVLDLGERPRFHNSLRVQTPDHDFINWVEVAASDDAHIWRIVNARAPISRFRKDNIEGNQTIHYSENNARYLRTRIQEAGESFHVTDIEIFSTPVVKKEASAETVIPLSTSQVPDQEGQGSETQWTSDLGSDSIPVAKFVFETSQPEFYRAVRIRSSTDQKEWQFAGGGEIHRYVAGRVTEESLAVQCYESWGPRYWRIEVLNGNDAALSAVRLSVAMPMRFVLFRAMPNRSYRLIYGNARAATPQYDLARTLQIPAVEAMSRPNLGAEEITSNYADPRPFTERHPNLLWIALGVAVVLLGSAAVRALRATAPAETNK